MRKIITLMLILVGLSAYASKGRVYYVSGDIDAFKGQTEEIDVSVVLDLSNATYKRNDKLENFLRLCRRDRGWETSCLDFFYEKFNREILCMTACDESASTKYRIHIKVWDVNAKGEIAAEVFVSDLKSLENKEVLHLILIGYDGDVDDTNPMRDPMKDAGEVLGKFFNRLINGNPVEKMQDQIKIKKGKLTYRYNDMDYYSESKYRRKMFEDIVSSIVFKDTK